MLGSQILDLKILGNDLYYIVNSFWIYSFFGWIWESSFVSVKKRKLVNRGFVTGPVLTLYGFGAVLVYMFLHPFSNHILTLFFGGMVVATILEYITGVLMRALFHTKWWDYSDKKFNFQGIVCLGSSIGWGFFSLLLFYAFQPIVGTIVALYPRHYGEFFVNLVTMVYCVDFGMSAFAAFHVREKLSNLDKTWDEFQEFLQKSRLGEASAYMKNKTEAFYQDASTIRIKSFVEDKKRYFSDYLDRISEDNLELKESLMERKDIYLEKFDRFLENFMRDQKALDRITKRYIKAYPHLGIIKRFKKDDKKDKKNQ